jgi:soluble lytic murein transglycosylase-like protein
MPYSTDIALLFAFIEVESSFNPKAFLMDRNGGSYGLNQMDLPTAKDNGYDGTGPGLFDPFTNIREAIIHRQRLTTALIKAGKYSVEALAAAYNEGLTGELEGRPDPDYEAKIVKAYAKWLTLFPVTPMDAIV